MKPEDLKHYQKIFDKIQELAGDCEVTFIRDYSDGLGSWKVTELTDGHVLGEHAIEINALVEALGYVQDSRYEI